MTKTMKNTQELAALISRYLDRKRLLHENPSVTGEMIDAFFRAFSPPEKEKDHNGAGLPRQTHAGDRPKGIEELIIHTDGASRGNPGKAGIGVAIYDKDYRRVEDVCRFIGETTNNVAEYQAMILAAHKAIGYHARKVTFKTDSELLVRQLTGVYRVKSPNILPLHTELMALLAKIPGWKILHVRREENAQADALANQGIDTRKAG